MIPAILQKTNVVIVSIWGIVPKRVSSLSKTVPTFKSVGTSLNPKDSGTIRKNEETLLISNSMTDATHMGISE